jgi:hypothetical protein
MLNRTARRSLQGATLTTLLLAGIAGIHACSSDDSSATGPATTTNGQGGSTSSTTTGGGGGESTSTTGGGSGGVSTGGGNGGTGGAKGGAGGGGGTAGSGGSGGAGGSKDAGADTGSKDGGGSDAPTGDGAAACTPGPLPAAGMMYARTGWGGQWTPPCNFTSGNGTCKDLPTSAAFDGKGNTRTSLGDTHTPIAQVIGDTFTFDMKTCNLVGRIVMFAAAPPNNQGSFDARDFPGAVDVTVSSDCMSSAQGAITGTFGPVVAMGTEPQPGCQNNGMPCNMPFTITFAQPVPAQCVKLRLTKVLQIGGGVWWAIDELYVYPN